MASVFIPIMVLIIIIYGFYKKIDIYDQFMLGVEEGLALSLKLFPVIFSMMICTNVLISCNIISDIIKIFKPFLILFDYPLELIPLAILRPISSSSALIVMDNILKIYSPDSFVGRVASVLQGSTDTTIYILGLYFSSVGIKKTKYALVVGLFADLMAVVFSFLVIKILFY